MNEEQATEILKSSGFLSEDGGLYDLGAYVAWNVGAPTACLDGSFTADRLEAIAWWMRNKITK